MFIMFLLLRFVTISLLVLNVVTGHWMEKDDYSHYPGQDAIPKKHARPYFPSYDSHPIWDYDDDSKESDGYDWPGYDGDWFDPPTNPFFPNGQKCKLDGSGGKDEINKCLEGLLQQAIDSIGTIPDPPSNNGGTNDEKAGQGDGNDSNGVQIIPNLPDGNATDSINIEETYFKPTFQNTTYLRKCGEYYRQVPLLKGNHTPIVGGRPAAPKQFPHLALLGYGEENNIQWRCGGSLISDQYVLTAAHCVFHITLRQVNFIRLGELDLNNATEESDVKDFTVIDRIRHPLYKPLSNYHDIGIVRMNASVSFNSYIRPICLATTNDLDGKTLVIAGWGLTATLGFPSSVLLRASLQHFPFEECRRAYGTPRNIQNGIIDAIQVCADSSPVKRDACNGDSGGPLQYTNYDYEEERDLRGFIEIVGITSFGMGCGLIAGVYTRVLPYVQWIEKIVWPNETP